MTDISTFPTLTDDILVNDGGGAMLNMVAGEALTAGQVVGFAATGVSKTMHAMDKTASEHPVGAVLHDVTSGDRCVVAALGCVVTLVNADDTTAIDAGDWVEWNDNAVKGTVSAWAPRADLGSTVIDGTNDTTIDGSTELIGMALEDIAGDGSGEVLLQPRTQLWSDHAVV